MARPIEATPVLSGRDALRFVQRMNKPTKETAASVDFKVIRENILKKKAEGGKKSL